MIGEGVMAHQVVVVVVVEEGKWVDGKWICVKVTSLLRREQIELGER